MSKPLQALAKISLMGCRCIADGNPSCPGCTDTGRKAPVIALKALRDFGLTDHEIYLLTQE